jgi:hypothetical protein
MYYNTITDIINDLRPVKKNVTEFITLQSHAKGRPPQGRDAHDIVMAMLDIHLERMSILIYILMIGVRKLILMN